ncbi:MAG: site-specific integrase [Herminiimonas sp.]|nr:site-specific integrase [Herminiimonas sp.]
MLAKLDATHLVAGRARHVATREDTKMASVYKHRNAWQAAVGSKDNRVKKNFATQKAALAWACQAEADLKLNAMPVLGGPSRVTLAGALMEYAHKYTVTKKSFKSELDRINRYLIAAGLPTLHREELPGGGFELLEVAPAMVDAGIPDAFKDHRDMRLDKRTKTNALRAELARTLVSHVSSDKLRTFMTQMAKDGLGGSTALKEMALLKHAFNMAINEWNWTSFVNPLKGMKLPRPAPGRERLLNADEEHAMRLALAECENPFMLPLFEFALETTSRRGSLLKLNYCDVDIEGRIALLYDTKSGDNNRVPLTQRAVQILQRLPREPNESRVFPLSANAVTMAWRRACIRAGVDDLKFHDTRHVGTTRHAKRVKNVHALMKITGHKTVGQLMKYVHVMEDDIFQAFDATEPPAGSVLLPIDHHAESAQVVQARAKAVRLNARALQDTAIAQTPLLPSNVFSIGARRPKPENVESGTLDVGVASELTRN